MNNIEYNHIICSPVSPPQSPLSAAFWLCVWKDAGGQSAVLAAHACSRGSARRQPSLRSYLPPIRPPAGQAQPCCNWLSPTEPGGGFRLLSCSEKPITHCCTPTHCRPIERGEGVRLWIHPEKSTACVCWFRSKQVGTTEIWLTGLDQCEDDGSACVKVCRRTSLQKLETCSTFWNLSQRNIVLVCIVVRVMWGEM